MSSERDNVELLQGALDLIVLRALATMGPQHAYALATRLEQIGRHSLTLNQGTLYPALVRLDQRGWIKGTWQKTPNNREANTTRLRRRACASWPTAPSAGAASPGSSTPYWSTPEAGHVSDQALHPQDPRVPST